MCVAGLYLTFRRSLIGIGVFFTHAAYHQSCRDTANIIVYHYCMVAGLGCRVSGLLLVLLWSLVEVHSQTAPYLTFMGETLPNHAFVNLSLVGNAVAGSDSVQCHTDLNTCCSGSQGVDRGDWYFPSGDRLTFSASNVVYESRVAQRVDLRRDGNADMLSGIYRCDIETNAVNSGDNTARETVYAGIYTTGGKLTLLLQLH